MQVTEYCDGGSLYTELRKPWPQAVLEARLVPWALDIATGMEYLHTGLSKPVVHRDLKSPNVLITWTEREDGPRAGVQGVLKICDFGSSTIFKAKEMRTQAGTFAWNSPEMARNEISKLGPACDVWSFGVILWEMLTQTVPYSHLDNEWAQCWLVASGAKVAGFKKKDLFLARVLARALV